MTDILATIPRTELFLAGCILGALIAASLFMLADTRSWR